MSAKSAPELRPYQTAAIQSVVDAMGEGQNRVLIQMCTGAGKTVFFAALPQSAEIRDWLETFPPKERKVLIIAHREELLTQAVDKIQKANPNVRVGIEQADQYASMFCDVVVASIQTLQSQKFKRLHRLMKRHAFRIVIVDESHHASAATYRTALAHLGFLPMADASDEENTDVASYDDVDKMTAALAGWDAIAPKDRLLIGVTATPNRSDSVGLSCVFQTLAFQYGVRDAINDGWLVPVVPWVIETGTSLDAVRTNRGDFNQRELQDAVNHEQRNKLGVAGWKEHADDLSTLAFTVGVEHAHALAEEFRKVGVAAIALSGETPKIDRRQALEAYSNGRIKVIANAQLFTEGTDLPITACILHAKPTKSATLYTQMSGRALRLYPGKTHAVLIDLVDVARRHSLQAAPVLYGLPPGLRAQGNDLRKVADALEAIQAKHPGFMVGAEAMTLEDMAARAHTFDIWSVPSLGDVGSNLAMNWIKVGEDSYRLQYPWEETTEMLLVEKDLLGKFTVVLSKRSKDKEKGGSLARTLAKGLLSAQAALQTAETFLTTDRRAVMRLKDREAAWRSRPASSRQMAILQKMKAPVHPGMTAGSASDLIDIGFARKR